MWTEYVGGRSLANLALVCLTLQPLPASAVNVDGLVFPDDYTVGAEKLQVNGYGSRLYSFLKVKVYSAALYTPQKSADAQALINSKAPRVLFLKMRVDSKKDDAIEAWKHYLRNNCSKPCPVPESRWQPFLNAMATLKEGDTEAYIFTGQGFELKRNEHTVVKIDDVELSALVLSGWLGREPTTPELKAALLGQ
jgi:hypothetical protein